MGGERGGKRGGGICRTNVRLLPTRLESVVQLCHTASIINIHKNTGIANQCMGRLHRSRDRTTEGVFTSHVQLHSTILNSTQQRTTDAGV